ncbi:hypothetical protein BT96DRAFT_1010757 [Gymnopus androsaceus JB14]|uniref:Uncharacterized protein n=1 Tax=Gymnopus androsaceus JB14 TaxID=1447944 RepID=A0A6A4GA98_9AGAR|nr:hypothetical protein BT96DRAFT_1010757 [Gymnopus androsaceus JB14]
MGPYGRSSLGSEAEADGEFTEDEYSGDEVDDVTERNKDRNAIAERLPTALGEVVVPLEPFIAQSSTPENYKAS